MNNDLISRSDLIKWIDDSVSQYGGTYSTDMMNMWGLFKDYLINNVPTVEPKKGKWIEQLYGTTLCRFSYFTCDNCETITANKTNFCPKCGADMREENNE